MKTITGAAASAQVFTTNNAATAIEPYAIAQLQMLCDLEASKDSIIRVMPDVHPGKVGTIGLTMTVGDKILPNLIGIDIGCGMTLAQIQGKKIEYQRLDAVIREHIPSGFQIRSKMHRFAEDFDFDRLRCASHIRKEKATLSLGTLGGGNHFIECDTDDSGNLYVVIHTGSRHLGKEVTEYYLNAGQKSLKKASIDTPYELTWLEGQLKDDYLHDLQIVQQFASLNRESILDELVNTDWNCSAPHGSGRILKREDVSKQFTVSAYKSAMKGIYSSCIGKDTLDEAPFAYRGIDEIREVISDTVTVDAIIRPIYNFKAGGNQDKAHQQKETI